MVKTTVHLPADQRARLRALALRERRSQSALVRAAIDRYLDAEFGDLPRSIGMGDDPDLHGAEVDAWLHREWRP